MQFAIKSRNHKFSQFVLILIALARCAGLGAGRGGRLGGDVAHFLDPPLAVSSVAANTEPCVCRACGTGGWAPRTSRLQCGARKRTRCGRRAARWPPPRCLRRCPAATLSAPSSPASSRTPCSRVRIYPLHMMLGRTSCLQISEQEVEAQILVRAALLVAWWMRICPCSSSHATEKQTPAAFHIRSTTSAAHLKLCNRPGSWETSMSVFRR